MKVSSGKGLVWVLGACISLQAMAQEPCGGVNTSQRQESPAVRKLTLSIGQSAASVSSDPALAGIVAAVPFEKGIAVYVNQPFDLTYQQEGLTFRVPRTHTLWMTSSDKKLTEIGIALCPLFEDDFDAAVRMVKEWRQRFDDMNLEEIKNHPRFPARDIESMKERFKAAKFPKYGEAVGLWRRGDTYMNLDLARVEREYFDRSKNAVSREAYLYKVSVGLLDAKEFGLIYGEATTR
jgi:hypothetical protein